MNRRIFFLGVLLIGSLTAVGYIVFAKGKHQQPLRQGFTLRITNTAYAANGSPFISSTAVRYRKPMAVGKRSRRFPTDSNGIV